MKHTTKLYLIIASLIAVIFWRECLHQSRIATLKQLHWEEIAHLEDNYADICDDAIAEEIEKAREQGRQEILEQF